MLVVMAAAFFCVAVASACGGGGTSNPGTTPGAYTVTVTGNATGAGSATTQITVNVS